MCNTMDLLEVGCGDMDWIKLANATDSWRALANAVMKLHFHNMKEFFE